MAGDKSQGFGLGLRPVYYPHILEGPQPVDWFEIISENFNSSKKISYMKKILVFLQLYYARTYKY